MSFASSAPLRPIASGLAWRIEFLNASFVCPDSVRPLLSTIVPEINTGMRLPTFSKNRSSAYIAALAFSESKIVSTRNRSTPPAYRPSAYSRYACTTSSYVQLRYSGFSTDGDTDSVRFVGPMAPATKRGLFGVFAVHSAHTRFASFAPSVLMRLTCLRSCSS